MVDFSFIFLILVYRLENAYEAYKVNIILVFNILRRNCFKKLGSNNVTMKLNYKNGS